MIKRIAFAFCLGLALAATSVGARSRTIVSDKITVPASKYVYYQFSVSGNSEIQGRFRVEGGSGNDIECYILDADGFENWRNGHGTRTWYNSGRVTVASIYAKVPKGEYFLVFNNGFAWLSNKVVAATVEVR
jgi:hypothetical protein